eukprot:scaffold82839_cov34-Phaeocystis_antarctica.AAC.2
MTFRSAPTLGLGGCYGERSRGTRLLGDQLGRAERGKTADGRFGNVYNSSPKWEARSKAGERDTQLQPPS